MGHHSNQLEDELTVDLIELRDGFNALCELTRGANRHSLGASRDKLDEHAETDSLGKVLDPMEWSALTRDLDVVDLCSTAAHGIGDLELAKPKPLSCRTEPLSDSYILHV